MKTKITILVLALLSVGKYSQAQTVSYKVIYDDPVDINNLFVSAHPFFCEAGDIGGIANIGYVVQVDYNMFKRLSFTANYTKAYLDILADGSKKVTGTDKLLSKHGYQEAGTSFFLLDKLKTKNIGITLKSTSTTTTSISVPGTRRIQTGFRGGIFHYNYGLDLEDGEYFIGKNSETGTEDSLIADFLSYKEFQTNMNVFGAYVGFVRRKSNDISVSVEGYGVKKNRRLGEFYVDFVSAMAVTFQDINYQPMKYANGMDFGPMIPDGPLATYDLSPTPKNLLGWRMGYTLIYPGRLGAQMKCEMGKKPGWGQQSGYYINASFGITFGAKLKFSKPKEI